MDESGILMPETGKRHIKTKLSRKEIFESVDERVANLNKKYARMYPSGGELRVKFYMDGRVSLGVPKLSLCALTEIHEDLRFLKEFISDSFIKVKLEE